jgi:hypothetical protein
MARKERGRKREMNSGRRRHKACLFALWKRMTVHMSNDGDRKSCFHGFLASRDAANYLQREGA